MKLHLQLHRSILAKRLILGTVLVISSLIIFLPIGTLEKLCSIALLAALGMKTLSEQNGGLIFGILHKEVVITANNDSRHYALISAKRLGILRILIIKSLQDRRYKKSLWLWQDMFANDKEWRLFNAWLNSRV